MLLHWRGRELPVLGVMGIGSCCACSDSKLPAGWRTSRELHGMGIGRSACLLCLGMKGAVGSFYRGFRPWTERGELQRGVHV